MDYSPIVDTAILCGLLIAALHWFPWRRLLGADLHRLLTYALGVSVILGIPSLLYLRYQPDWKMFGVAKPSAFVGVENLTNKSYVPVGYETFSGLSYYPAPEINYRGGISLYF
jgi:hypothetical protein